MSESLSEVFHDLDASLEWSAYGGNQQYAIEYLGQYLGDKGFTDAAIEGLAKQGDILGKNIDQLMLGNFSHYGEHDDIPRARFLNFMVLSAFRDSRFKGDLDSYGGTAYDNESIQRTLTLVSTREADDGTDVQRAFRRNGASRQLFIPRVSIETAQSSERLQNVPIAIIGGGASGVISSAYLSQLGFRNITIFDKRGKTNGLWDQDNVRQGTKNNPFDITFGDFFARSAAQSREIEGSGRDIERYLNDIFASIRNPIAIRKAKVKGVKPGDLNHKITFVEDGEEKTEVYPIVIYAPGIGQPLDPSDPIRMKTPMKKNEVGQRWQRQFDDDDLQRLGQRVVLVGLGNSTAEVVHQLQRKGIDYRILTHKPMRSLVQPDGVTHRLYRDTKKPELTQLAGDLAHINRMFIEARDSGKILSGVREWSHEGGVVTSKDRDGIETRIPFDSLFTLIGYGQNPEVNTAFGLVTHDDRTGSIGYDYDGEIHRTETVAYGHYDFHDGPRNRIYPGYFALGPILKTENNPNALVIPGIQYQLQFLASTLMMRAAEMAYSRRKFRGPQPQPEPTKA